MRYDGNGCSRICGMGQDNMKESGWSQVKDNKNYQTTIKHDLWEFDCYNIINNTGKIK